MYINDFTCLFKEWIYILMLKHVMEFEIRGKKSLFFYYLKDGISTHAEFRKKYFLIMFYAETLTLRRSGDSFYHVDMHVRNFGLCRKTLSNLLFDNVISCLVLF